MQWQYIKQDIKLNWINQLIMNNYSACTMLEMYSCNSIDLWISKLVSYDNASDKIITSKFVRYIDDNLQMIMMNYKNKEIKIHTQLCLPQI